MPLACNCLSRRRRATGTEFALDDSSGWLRDVGDGANLTPKHNKPDTDPTQAREGVKMKKNLRLFLFVISYGFFDPTVTSFAQNVSFKTPVNFAITGIAPNSVALGDFNGDGKQDLAVANQSSGNVSILLGNGNGSFGAATNFAAGFGSISVAAGDFNGDGKQDLAVANANSNNVSILLGNGNGSFGSPINIPVGSNPNSVAVGDFNGDGRQDLAVANFNSGNVSILLGNGNGSFGTATNFVVGSGPTSVAVGDFNGDERQDLAVANANSNNVSILLGNGAGSFGAVTNFAVGSSPNSVTVGDFNGDGRQDLAVANFNSGNVSILLGNGAGSFGTATNFVVGSGPTSVAVGDFNGDGRRDLAVANFNSDSVSILLGNGNGSFGSPTNILVGSRPTSVAAGDFSGDGKQDLVVANASSNNLSVLINGLPTKRDGQVNIEKLSNISTRGRVLTGDNVMIGGFIIEGSESLRVLVRSRGPSMSGAPFFITGTLANPLLRLFSGETMIAQNDNWQDAPSCFGFVCEGAAAITATGLDPCEPNPGQTGPPSNCAQESAILITLPPGAYTAIVTGANGGTGVGLVEMFEADASPLSELSNISTRGFVQTGDNVMIAGLIIEASAPKSVLIRARGPSMSGAPFFVSGTLANPFLQLFSEQIAIAQNDNWQDTPICSSGFTCAEFTEIIATGLDPCQPNPGQTASPPGCLLESAILITLPPGAYTAIVSGLGGITGVGLVEVFEVD